MKNFVEDNVKKGGDDEDIVPCNPGEDFMLFFKNDQQTGQSRGSVQNDPCEVIVYKRRGKMGQQATTSERPANEYKKQPIKHLNRTMLSIVVDADVEATLLRRSTCIKHRIER
ncbi:hypothetical protein AMTR_s00022p00245400 [Amborella trichopoda]|uniref:Uncharacterized protein n=1 Tax=Amborella trichopoda TaxID=13333 RepID=W1PUN1_AMBTC|nr:hypothetical protein AMTR_s00022p00245400 [Amborella trichopoda]